MKVWTNSGFQLLTSAILAQRFTNWAYQLTWSRPLNWLIIIIIIIFHCVILFEGLWQINFGWTYNALASLMFKDACLSHAKHVAALNPFESVKCVSDRTRILYQSLRSIYVTVFSRAGLFLDTFESTHSFQDDACIWSIRYQRGKLNVIKRQKILNL